MSCNSLAGLIGWLVSGVGWRFFPILLRKLKREQRTGKPGVNRGLNTTHLEMKPGDLPARFGYGQAIVGVAGLEAALNEAFEDEDGASSESEVEAFEDSAGSDSE